MTCYKYLLSFEDDLYTREHPYNIRVIRVRKACEKIVQLEEELENLRAELNEALKDMRRRRRVRRGGR